jgi:hypothetical protein
VSREIDIERQIDGVALGLAATAVVAGTNYGDQGVTGPGVGAGREAFSGRCADLSTEWVLRSGQRLE